MFDFLPKKLLHEITKLWHKNRDKFKRLENDMGEGENASHTFFSAVLLNIFIIKVIKTHDYFGKQLIFEKYWFSGSKAIEAVDSLDQDRMAQNVLSDLDLNCPLLSIYI